LESAGTVVLTYTTIASNTASSGGGGIHNSNPASLLLLHNVLLAHNLPVNCGGTVASNGHNLSDDGSCALSASDLVDLPARIGPLAEDGGTLVHPLLPGSPAIDAGLCVTGVTTDQRGQPRPDPASPFCDIGAYEAAGVGLADLVFAKTVIPAQVAPGAPLTYVLTFTNAGPGGASGVVVTDLVPVSVTVQGVISSGVSITETGPGHTGRYGWQVQDLLRGQGGAITLTGVLTIGVPAGPLTNTAGITATTADPSPGNNQAQAQVTVLNLAPVASNVVETTTQDIQLHGTLPAFDANGDALLFGILAAPITGSVTISDSATGAYVYTPLEAWFGIDHFTYIVTDSGGLTDTGTVTVEMLGHAPPSISDIPDQVTSIGVPAGPITFTVGDPDTPASALSVWAISSDTGLVPLSAIDLGGAGVERTIAITPTAGLSGTATITVHVSDGSSQDSDAFLLTVEPYRVYLPLVLRRHQ
jgi:uncharacterized repeat protein (TIGR01451 family)